MEPLRTAVEQPLAQARAVAGLRVIRDLAGVLVHCAPLRETRAHQT